MPNLSAFGLFLITAVAFSEPILPQTSAQPEPQQDDIEHEIVEPLGLPPAPPTKPPQNAIKCGADALAERDYEKAFAEYRAAFDMLPDSPENRPLRSEAREGFTKAAIGLAEQRIAEGRWQDATETVRTLLKSEYNPNSKQAKELLTQLEDPRYFNKTVTPGFVVKVEEIKRLLIESEGFFDSGRYDEAIATYERALQLDPYNLAAWKGIERVNQMKARVMEAADQARRPLLSNRATVGSSCNIPWLQLLLIALPAALCVIVILGAKGNGNAHLFCGLLVSALLAYLLAAVMLRYEVIIPRKGETDIVYRLDRWTGAMERMPKPPQDTALQEPND